MSCILSTWVVDSYPIPKESSDTKKVRHVLAFHVAFDSFIF